MDPVTLERLYRIRKSLPPEIAREVELAYEGSPAPMAPRSPQEEFDFRTRGTRQPDPLDAADISLPADPPVGRPGMVQMGPPQGPDRNRSRADWAVDFSMAGLPYSPGENVDSMDVTDVPSQNDLRWANSVLNPRVAGQADVPPGYAEWAEARHDAETGTTKAQRMAELEATERRQAQFEEDYNRATGSPQPSGLPMNDGYRDWTGWQRGMPIPEAMSDTQRVLANRAAAEAERDARLKPMLDADKRDAQARAQWKTDNPKDAAQLDMKAKERSDDYRKERLLYRMAQQTGKSVEQLRAENPQFQSVGHTRDGSMTQLVKTKNGFEVRETPASTSRMRDDMADRRNAAAQKREDAWRAQMMLAGGQPTDGVGGTKAITNALMMLPPDQRNSSLRYMLPGGDRAAAVDARQLDMAAQLAQRAVMGALAGTAQGPLAQAQAEMAQLQAQAERDKLRAQDEDILGDKYAKGGWLGYDEFTIAEQQQMYDDLIAQGYKPGEAQRAVDRQASKRRASQRKQWNP